MLDNSKHGKGNNKGYDKSKGRETIAEKAQKFTTQLIPMLNLESATAETIKNGISTVNKMLELNKNITAHQVRNIFDLINEIEPSAIQNDTALKDLNKLRPKLAYIGARQTNMDGKIIVQVLDDLIIHITDNNQKDQIQNEIAGLRYIMESIVAYQKFHSKN